MILKGLNMNEQVAIENISYSDLVQEAYLDPIRTVIVIDDEFPTLDSLISKELGQAEQAWSGKTEHVEKVNKILDFCREKEKPWLVDIHDGKNEGDEQEECIASYLHHSDLVILDYHLDGDDNGGDKAINILRQLAQNDHFNLVVVYTKGDKESGGAIDRVVHEITLGLTATAPELSISESSADKVKKAIGEWELEDEDILAKLKTEVTEQTYLAIRCKNGGDYKRAVGLPECQAILELYKNRPNEVKIGLKDLLQWLLNEKENELKGKLSSVPLGTVTVSAPGKDVNWIRTDRLFVTVVSKNNQPNEIPEKLLQALNEWCPRPHRLLMAKMRSLIDERGVVAEAEVLSDDYIQTGWLVDLLDTHEQDRMGAINKTINRHWEALGDALITDISEFGGKLIQYIGKESRDDIISTHSPLLPSKEAQDISKRHNCYVSTKPVDGYHLTIGHVLEFPPVEGKCEYGLCLSPACDMVPGQKKSGWFGRLGEHTPFIMVSLNEIKAATALENVYQNNSLFLNISGEIKTFSFNPNGDIKSNPAWEQMFVQNSGNFTSDDKTLTVGRLREDSADLKIDLAEVKVVAQLRYEYALNLLQRLGISLTRIGLDFKNLSLNDKKKADG